jgi:single-strand DNA-binding protein
MNPVVTLVGNLVTEPEVRFTPSGKAVASARMVTKDRTKDDGGEWHDKDPTFYTVTVWDKVAEQLAEAMLAPGQEVVVVGKLSNREYETKEGEKRTSLDVNAYTFGVVVNRFTTLKVAKVERSSEPAKEDPWSGAAATDEPPF